MGRQTAQESTITAPPTVGIGPLRWLKKNLFSTWHNASLTLLVLVFLYFVLRPILQWALVEADWQVIPPNLKLLLVGTYPTVELWRVWTALAVVMLLLGVSGGVWGGLVREAAIGVGSATLLTLLLLAVVGWGERLPVLGINGALFGGIALGWRVRRGRPLWRRVVPLLWLLSPLLIVFLIRGFTENPILPHVRTSDWGGLMLTFMLAIVGIALSFPFGVLLALGRQSGLPAMRWIAVAYIELIRGVPLITLLFMAAIMLPFFLPTQIRPDLVIRAITAFTMFTAAYIAENVRGGLQAIPRGQIEAAQALGLGPVLTTVLIVLPQALRAVIPANVGQFISLFKDTSLVLIVPLLDFLGIALNVLENPKWGGPAREMFLFVGFVYWTFSYFMSYMSRRLERALGVGER